MYGLLNPLRPSEEILASLCFLGIFPQVWWEGGGLHILMDYVDLSLAGLTNQLGPPAPPDSHPSRQKGGGGLDATLSPQRVGC